MAFKAVRNSKSIFETNICLVILAICKCEKKLSNETANKCLSVNGVIQNVWKRE